MTSAHALAGSTEELLKHIHRLCFDKSKDWSNSKASVKANDTILLRTQAHSGPNKGQQPGQSFLISKVGPCRICGILLTVASLEEVSESGHGAADGPASYAESHLLLQGL